MSELQAQCWICPHCHDDKHHEPGDQRCQENIQAQVSDRLRIAESALQARRVMSFRTIYRLFRLYGNGRLISLRKAITVARGRRAKIKPEGAPTAMNRRGNQ